METALVAQTKISALIIDDEPLARRRIEGLLKDETRIQIKGIIGTGEEAVRTIDSLKPDMIFLDIQLKDMTGFEVLESITEDPPLIVFVTAFDAFAIKAFEVFAFDYLLKPYTEERFYKSVANAIASFEKERGGALEKKMAELLGHMNIQPETAGKKYKRRIPIPDKKKTRFVNTEDIMYIKASNYYIEIYTTNSKHVLRESLYHILEGLDPQHFARIHRSSIVNLGHIKELLNSDYGEVDVKMPDSALLRVSKGYRKGFLTKIGLRS